MKREREEIIERIKASTNGNALDLAELRLAYDEGAKAARRNAAARTRVLAQHLFARANRTHLAPGLSRSEADELFKSICDDIGGPHPD